MSRPGAPTTPPAGHADLVILDRDPLTTSPQELREIAVLKTIKDGEVADEAQR